MRWIISDEQPAAAKIAAEHSISLAAAYVLLNRGISSTEEINSFLNVSSKNLSDTSTIADYEKGIKILKQALDNSEKIYIYGDYDVDGVMSTTILYKALLALDANVSYFVPHRVYDGYGLNPEAIKRIHKNDCQLLITCDTGIAALSEIKLAKKLGMKVLVLDHHEPVLEGEKQRLPDADAVIDCKRSDSRFTFREMCAAGLCYRFVKDLYKCIERKFSLDRELVTFAGIATVCDVVALREDNRILAKLALYLLNNDIKNPGLRCLTQQAVGDGREITAHLLSFRIGPCINAAGRLGSAKEAVELFIADDDKKAFEFAEILVQKNEERKAITQSTVERLEKLADPSLPVQVLYDPDIHESITGLAAGRITEKLCRPTLVITNGENGCKGSGRSTEHYDLHKNMSAVSELFTKFGGHAKAAGFSLPYENIGPLRKALNETCTLSPEQMTPAVKLDCELSLSELSYELACDIENLEPFGEGVPAPIFFTHSAELCSVRLVGADKTTVQLSFRAGEKKWLKGVIFYGKDKIMQYLNDRGLSEYAKELESKNQLDTEFTVDIAYLPVPDTFNGKRTAQLIIKDMR